ncbi:mRNA-decapping enzyme 1A [Lutzomyia longipalpis]|uniref:Putative mrna-decapping enzyme 1a-like protein n=1 Tax=Lutzomyia longipalpis TaxID=7200 RepID=A0A1B0CJA2_LUTLO|nr:mRNA-decapping enzyme 1A [Lutzomyia longipalpis]
MADELRMNLAAVKRADPYAKDIVETSAHVAFYTFNYEDNEWEKTDVEGAFFVYRRNAEPFHSIFINNRLNTNSLVEPITADLEIQSQPPFLLYRNERSRIRGFWFYNKNELERVADLILKYVKECQKQRDMEVNATETDVRQKSVNIFSMLSKAQEDFDKANSTKKDGGGQRKHPEETVGHANATPQSVMNFFAAAAKPTAKEPPLLQRLMSNPAHSVEHIEKQQRAVTPQDMVAGRPASPQRQENGVANILRRSATSPHAAAAATESATSLPQSWASVLQSANQRTATRPSDKDTDDLYQLLKRADASNSSTSSSIKPALMPPTMFRKAGATSPTSIIAGEEKPEPLTQNQLLQAMTYLIKNDPEFVKKLHEAYLKSFSEMVSL